MEWLTEDPTWPVMLGILAAGTLGFAAYATSKRLFTVLTLLVVFLTIGIVIAERYIITDREQIRITLFDIASYVSNNRHADVLRHIDPDAPGYRRAESEMPNYIFRNCSVSGVRYINVTEGSPAKAEVNFVVFVDVNANKTYQYDGVGRREVTLFFEKNSNGVWKVVNYSHRHPTGGAGFQAGSDY